VDQFCTLMAQGIEWALTLQGHILALPVIVTAALLRLQIAM